MENEERSYKVPGIIALVIVALLFASFIITPKIIETRRNSTSGNSLVDGASAEDTANSAVSEWKEETYGDANQRVTRSQALAAAKRAMAMTTLRNYYTAEMQYFAENMTFTENIDSLYVGRQDTGPYQITIDAFGADSVKITAKGNIDNDDDLDILQMDAQGKAVILNNDLAN